jgi:hypothetical protein
MRTVPQLNTSRHPQDVIVLDPGGLDPTVRWDTTKEYGISPDKTSELLLRALIQDLLLPILRIWNYRDNPITSPVNEDLIKRFFSPRPAGAETPWTPCK